MANEEKNENTSAEPQQPAAGTTATASENKATAAPKVEEIATNATTKEKKSEPLDPNKLGILNNVSIAVTIEVGRAQIKIRDLLNLTKGSIIELNKSAGDPVDVYANGKLISIGNIITANGKYCVKLTSMPDNSDLGVEPDGK